MLRFRFWLQRKLGMMIVLKQIVDEQYRVNKLWARVDCMERDLEQILRSVQEMKRQLESNQCIVPERYSRSSSSS